MDDEGEPLVTGLSATAPARARQASTQPKASAWVVGYRLCVVALLTATAVNYHHTQTELRLARTARTQSCRTHAQQAQPLPQAATTPTPATAAAAAPPTQPPPEAEASPSPGGLVQGAGEGLWAGEEAVGQRVVTPSDANAYKARLAGQASCGSTSGEAYVTCCSSSSYLPGIVTLAHQLRALGSERPLIVMATSGCTTFGALLDLRAAGVQVCVLEYIPNPKPKRHFTHNYNKLSLYALPLQVAVFIDADMLPFKNIDDMFSALGQDKVIGANCDCSKTHEFNSGLVVVKPGEVDFAHMLEQTAVLESPTGGDQGFVNKYFLKGKDCQTAHENPDLRFHRVAETDEWERIKDSNTHKYSVLWEWLKEKDYRQLVGGDQMRQHERAILDHFDQIRVVHFVSLPKVWDVCRHADTCDTRQGRGASLDRMYFRKMEEFGVFTNGKLTLGRMSTFRSPASLSEHLVHEKCPSYRNVPSAVVQFFASHDLFFPSMPRYHEAIACSTEGQPPEAVGVSFEELRALEFPHCYGGPFEGSFVKGCAEGCKRLGTFDEAVAACNEAAVCGGFTRVGPGAFELRGGREAKKGQVSETSWIKHDCPQLDEQWFSSNARAEMGGRYNRTLAVSLANWGFHKCGDPCVYSTSNPNAVAWLWNQRDGCWEGQAPGQSCFSKEHAASHEGVVAWAGSCIHGTALYDSRPSEVMEYLWHGD